MQFKFMKMIYLVGLFLVTQTGSLKAQNFFIEDFSYGVLTDLSGNGGWTNTGANSTNDIQVTSPGLIFPGYPGSNVGNTAYFTNVSNGDKLLKNFTTQTSGSVYYSCMLNVGTFTDSANAGFCIAFDEAGGATNNTARLMMQKVTANTFKLGITKLSSVEYSTTNFNTNTTYAIVVKYVFVPGTTNDSCMLFVFNTSIPSTEPSPLVFRTTGTDVDDLGQLVLSNSYSSTGLKQTPVRIDGVRVGMSWESSVLTGIANTSTEIPQHYSLQQNYPNPFNPSTTISFSLKNAGYTSLKIYNMIGQEIASLVNENLAAGTYDYKLNASGLSSGTYFYRLTSGSFTELKKMILIK